LKKNRPNQGCVDGSLARNRPHRSRKATNRRRQRVHGRVGKYCGSGVADGKIGSVSSETYEKDKIWKGVRQFPEGVTRIIVNVVEVTVKCLRKTCRMLLRHPNGSSKGKRITKKETAGNGYDLVNGGMCTS